jgi:hypothetical protein
MKEQVKRSFLNVPMPEELKREYKALCVAQGVTMEEGINKLVKKYVTHAKSKRTENNAA